MNVSLDLSPTQLSKLRNGHSIRISPAVVGRGTDLIIDPMTYNNLAKKLDKGKGAVFKISPSEINMNKMEETTGLFAGAGKVNRLKKANRWRDFSKDTVNIGMDLGQRGLDMYNKQKERPLKAIKGLFGRGEMEGGNIFKKVKKAYNKNVKNTELGKALRDTASNIIRDGYDATQKVTGSNKYTKPVSEHMKKNRDRDVKKITRYTGLGLRMSGRGESGSVCSGCGMPYNDQFLFSNVAI